MPIAIVPASPEWPQAFAHVKAALLPALPAGAKVHHIGSTSVPGLAVKDIIDVPVTVSTLAEIDDTALAAPVSPSAIRLQTTCHPD